MTSAIYEDLTATMFTLEDLLNQEADTLCACSPTKAEPKVPTGSTSQFTRMSKEGHGPGHCVVRRWPSEMTPAVWGEQNRTVLLDETIQPSVWKALEDLHSSFRLHHYRVLHSQLFPIRSNDYGNEQAFRDILQKLLMRVNYIACFFFLNQWLKHPGHHDFSSAVTTLKDLDIKVEHRSEDSKSITHDIACQINRRCPIPRCKHLSGTSDTAVLTMVNTKSTGHKEYDYQGFSSESFNINVRNVDQSLDIVVLKSESSPEGLSIAELDQFLADESKLAWPLIATSHLAQVRLLLSFLFVSCLLWMKMAYELDVCTSSLGMFSSIWGFHRVGLLTYPTQGPKVLYVSDNLAAQTTSAHHRVDSISNRGVVKEFFFSVVSAILLTYGERIIPPNLRDDRDFLSYFRG